MDELNIDVMCANSPAAKGRVERAHQTLQDRLATTIRGTWTWDGQDCAQGPHVSLDGRRIVFTAPGSRYVHDVTSDDGTRVTTVVLAPADHEGERYELKMSGSKLLVVSGGHTDEWKRCN